MNNLRDNTEFNGRRSDRANSRRRKNKKLKITFFIVEGILLVVVAICAVILKLIGGFTVFKLPEDKIKTNTEVAAESGDASDPSKGDPMIVDISKVPDQTLESYPTPFAGDEYTTIVVFGLDGRGLVESLDFGSNSDVMILVSINNNTGAVKMSSVYRDTIMKIFKADDVDKEQTVQYARANYAMTHFGVLSSINTLNLNLDLDIDHFVSFNWASAVEIIDALGGVDIELKKAYWEINSEKSPTGKVVYLNGLIDEIVKSTGIPSEGIPQEYFVDGTIWHANGVQAVAYMRLRYTDSDFKRTSRQREIIEKIVEKAKSASLSTLLDVLDIAKENISLSIDQSDLLGLLGNITKYHIEGSDGYPTTLYPGSAYEGSLKWMVIPLNVIENVRALHKFLYDQTDYSPSYNLQVINEEIRTVGLFDEDWNLTIEDPYFQPASTE